MIFFYIKKKFWDFLLYKVIKVATENKKMAKNGHAQWSKTATASAEAP